MYPNAFWSAGKKIKSEIRASKNAAERNRATCSKSFRLPKRKTGKQTRKTALVATMARPISSRP